MKFYVQTTLLEKRLLGHFTGKNKSWGFLLKIRKEYIYIRVSSALGRVISCLCSLECYGSFFGILPAHTSSLDPLPS